MSQQQQQHSSSSSKYAAASSSLSNNRKPMNEMNNNNNNNNAIECQPLKPMQPPHQVQFQQPLLPTHQQSSAMYQQQAANIKKLNAAPSPPSSPPYNSPPPPPLPLQMTPTQQQQQQQHQQSLLINQQQFQQQQQQQNMNNMFNSNAAAQPLPQQQHQSSSSAQTSPKSPPPPTNQSTQQPQFQFAFNSNNMGMINQQQQPPQQQQHNPNVNINAIQNFNSNNNNSAAAGGSNSANINPQSLPKPFLPQSTQSKLKKILKDNLILVLTIAGIFGGVAVGFIVRSINPRKEVLILIAFPGELLLRILKMLILPLIVSSLITGLAQLDPKSSGKMGSRALGFYVMTTVIATITGIIVALIIHPGKPDANKINSPRKIAASNSQQISTLDAMLDIVRNMFPENIVQACSQQVSTSYRKVNKTRVVTQPITMMMNMNMNQQQNKASLLLYQSAPYGGGAGGGFSTTSMPPPPLSSVNQYVNISETYEDVIRELKYTDGTNVMGLVVFCIIFGIFISHSKSEAQIMFDFFLVLNELIMKVVGLIMWYSPVGILFLIANNIIKIDNMAETAKRLSYYMFTVIVGLIIHALCTIQLMYFFTTRKNPLKFLKGMLQAWLTAVGTASSSATLPITFRCLEENNKVDKRVTRFMLPLGATVNMDGTALYQCVATLFIAQINGITLTLGQLVAVCFSATATSIGAASIPSAALVTMLIVLSTVGLPTEDLSYIVAVDWLLDRLRTSINVLGDAYGCGIIEHFSRNELKKLDEEAEHEFAQIISAGPYGPPMQQQQPQPQFLIDDQTFMPNYVNNNNNNNNNTNPLINICDETSYINNGAAFNPHQQHQQYQFQQQQQQLPQYRGGMMMLPHSDSITLQQQFNEFKCFDRRHSRQSQSSNMQQQQQQGGYTGGNNNISFIDGVPAAPAAPSVVVMDAVRRRSRVLLFSSRVPPSAKSMPQIADYANNSNNPNNKQQQQQQQQPAPQQHQDSNV